MQKSQMTETAVWLLHTDQKQSGMPSRSDPSVTMKRRTKYSINFPLKSWRVAWPSVVKWLGTGQDMWTSKALTVLFNTLLYTFNTLLYSHVQCRTIIVIFAHQQLILSHDVYLDNSHSCQTHIQCTRLYINFKVIVLGWSFVILFYYCIYMYSRGVLQHVHATDITFYMYVSNLQSVKMMVVLTCS